MLKFTLEELKGWNAFESWYALAEQTANDASRDYITLDEITDDKFKAWCLFKAGLCWPDDRYTPDIVTALIAMGKACYLAYSGEDLPDSRYIPEIATALIATGDAYYLEYAGENWPNSRYTPDIAEALIATGDSYYLEYASRWWPASRKEDLKND